MSAGADSIDGLNGRLESLKATLADRDETIARLNAGMDASTQVQTHFGETWKRRPHWLIDATIAGLQGELSAVNHR